MTIEQYAPRAEVALTTAQDVAVHRLTEWAHSAQAAHQIATTLVQTSFVPDSFRNKPGEATAAILAGLEVGLQPMAALRSFDVIQGQAAPRAITLRAIVQSHGHEMELVESTTTRCRMRGRRKGADGWQGVTWTIERAKDLGVTGKTNWKNQPQAMLVARATSELARLIASDAILGIAYSAEEIADGGTTETQADEATTAPEPTAGRVMRRRTTDPSPAPAGNTGAPASDRPTSDDEVVRGGTNSGPGGEPSSEASAGEDSPLLNIRSGLAKRMFAVLNDAGLGGKGAEAKAARLAEVGAIIGRTITSSEEMTDAEAEAVIATLEVRADVTEGELVDDE